MQQEYETNHRILENAGPAERAAVNTQTTRTPSMFAKALAHRLASTQQQGSDVHWGQNIDASGSGIVGGNINLKTTGNINGIVFARNNLNISAQQNVNVTALSEGTANVSAGDSISGTIIGVGGISASGGSVDASLLSNGSISGATSGQSGMAQGTAANATSAAASNDSNQTADKTASAGDGTDDDSKKKKPISLAQKVSRVTVILPTKTN